MIVCENLAKTFGGGHGIRGIDLEFSPGVIHGIIGYNGAGKTTLLNCIEGLLVPTAGSVFHDGIRTTDEKAFLPYRRRISFLPTYDFLYPNLTCGENLELATILRTGKNRMSEETKKLAVYFEVDGFWEKKFRDCSTGMKKKAQIVASLVGEVDTIIWDEPNDGIDIVSNIRIKNLLRHYREKGATILLSSHVIEFMEGFVDRCVLLHEGAIAENGDLRDLGSLEELFLKNLPADAVAFG